MLVWALLQMWQLRAGSGYRHVIGVFGVLPLIFLAQFLGLFACKCVETMLVLVRMCVMRVQFFRSPAWSTQRFPCLRDGSTVTIRHSYDGRSCTFWLGVF